jgi:hypothetical protein
MLREIMLIYAGERNSQNISILYLQYFNFISSYEIHGNMLRDIKWI